jgi:hypothetical protein
VTTIAYRDGILAADTRESDNGWIVNDHAAKLRPLPDGSVVALAGNRGEVEHAVAELALGADRLALQTGSYVIRLYADGKLRVYEGPGQYDLSADDYYAWGAGWPLAMAAMYAGADAERAVAIASRIEGMTGGRVVYTRWQWGGWIQISDIDLGPSVCPSRDRFWNSPTKSGPAP